MKTKYTISNITGFVSEPKNRIVVAICVVVAIPFLLRLAVWKIPINKDTCCSMTDQQEIVAMKQKIGNEISVVDKKLKNKIPQSNYLIINSSSNKFVLHKGEQVIKTGKCSTGSYILLKNGNDQQWMFKTPKGEFRIQGKITSPVWRKPDWAFVEDGLPVPSATDHSRYEYGVLGDYALSLGHGYLIHGTLYQRFLGLPVTHGCIRLNDEDLELVYKSLQVGSKVYIY